ncbi:cation diffusion facilitator family transporter [Aeromicrobium phragmitis]|uniref:Cation diffusion facilitator family transporter n=1 Tax=Aeromicrobium phragmitis TaxID=2478914 RepID=A0A3L8PHD2_9ACTN|nr:cation diffusion facilitator family transporter [Aeromicrobium phragmitis]
MPRSCHDDQVPAGSLLTVAIAFTANLAVAVAKSFAAAVTGSASMVAEAAHSWADTGNQVFLLVAERRGGRRPDRHHPYGYGRETYIWSMFAAFCLFTVGSVVSIMHGVQQLTAPEEEANYTIAYVVLALAFVLEGFSFLQALREASRGGRRLKLRTLAYVSRTSNPTLRAVFAEDSAALVGLVLAAGGLALHQVTGQAIWDAIGSIAIGLLLGFVAVFLIIRNGEFLRGQRVSERTRAEVLRRLLDRPSVERVTYLHIEYVGPSQLFLVAAVDIVGDRPEHQVAERLRALEAELEQHENVTEAVLTLATADERNLVP